MDPTTERLSRTIWIGVGLLIVILCLSFVTSRLQSKRTALPSLPVIGPVANFTLTNQDGRVVTLADLRGKVWIADIIFTRCPGPCARMTRQMESLQAALAKGSDARLVSLTTDPEYDTPEILKRYAKGYNADFVRWNFLTGEKLQIAELAADSLKLTALEKKPEERTAADDLFIHSTIFVLVDKQARLRTAFETEIEGMSWETIQSNIVVAVKQLERER